MELNGDNLKEEEIGINNENIDQNDDISNLEKKSIFELLNSKSENFRKEGYLRLIDEVKNNLSEESKLKEFTEKYETNLIKLFDDTNYISLEHGLDLIILILQKSINLLENKLKVDIFKYSVEKSFASTKTICKQKSQEIITLLYLNDDKQIYDEVILKILEANKPKVK